MNDGNDQSSELPEAKAQTESQRPDAERQPTGDSSQAPPASPEEQLATLVEEKDRLKDQLLRTAADYENFRKRTKRDLEEAERRGREEALRELLPVFDNLERAVEAAGSATDIQAVIDGVRMVLKLFEDVSSRIGLERVTAVGRRFDPNLHDAMQQQETSEHAPGTIVQELVPGYKLGDRLLRPALVVVARAPQKPPPGPGDGAAGGAV